MENLTTNKISKIILTDDFKKEILFNSLCNGLQEMNCYNLSIETKNLDYEKAKKSWLEKNKNQCPCIEDIFMEILLMGNEIMFEDEESDEVYRLNLSLSLQNMNKLPIWVVVQFLEENDDATSAGVVLQICLFGEIIFG